MSAASVENVVRMPCARAVLIQEQWLMQTHSQGAEWGGVVENGGGSVQSCRDADTIALVDVRYAQCKPPLHGPTCTHAYTRAHTQANTHKHTHTHTYAYMIIPAPLLHTHKLSQHVDKHTNK